MKLARALLSVLLAVLLPLQGAVAAAMLCPHEVATSPAHERSQPDDSMMDHGQRLDGGGMDPAAHPAHAGRQTGKCGLCAACGSGAAIVSVWPIELRFVPAESAPFAVIRSPAANFLSDGQERPPRSC